MKKTVSTFSLFLSFLFSAHAQYYFPPTSGDIWETTAPEDLGWCVDAIEPLYDFLEEKNTKAFMVLKDGRIVLEQYFNGFGQDSSWYWASAGKSLTAILVGIAQADGDLDINDPTSDYLGTGWTGCTPEEEAERKILNQLTMTTGMNDFWFECTTPGCLNCIADVGERWAYHNGPYRLLHKVVEAATGTNYNLYTFQKITQPTGMTGLWFITNQQLLFFSKARSMARFGSLIMNGGNWDGSPILDDPAYFENMVSPSQNLNESYGYLWWLNGKDSYRLPASQQVFEGPISPAAPDDLIAAMGKNGQFLDVVPSQGLVVVRMGEAPDESLVPNVFHDEIWVELSKVICTSTASGEESSPAPELQVLQNPFDKQLTVKALKNGRSLHLVDFWGREVATSTGPSINTEQLPMGIYFLQLKEKGQVVASERVVK